MDPFSYRMEQQDKRNLNFKAILDTLITPPNCLFLTSTLWLFSSDILVDRAVADTTISH
jgi:hypothetical protein